MESSDRLVLEHAAGYGVKPGSSRYWTAATKGALMERLGQYEDTGMSPAEVREMKHIVDTIDQVMVLGPRVLSREAFEAMEVGLGWQENWIEHANHPDSFFLERCAWAGENMAYDESGHWSKASCLQQYNQRYGVRIWVGVHPPTDEEREAEPWR